MRRTAVLVLALAGCLKPSAQQCKGGWACPAGLQCADMPTFCGAPAEIAACKGAADFSACSTSTVTAGYCQGGACQECVVDYAVCPAHTWTPMTYTGPDLASVFVRAPGSAIGVGLATVAEWDGVLWSTPTITSTEALRTVWVPPEGGNAWIVSGSTIYQWDGSALTTADMPAVTLAAGWASSQSDIYAVGAGGAIVHGSGAAYSITTLASGKPLTAVGGSSASDVYAVGSVGSLVHLEAGTWVQKTLPADVATVGLKAVWADTATDVFAVGNATTIATILHFDGTSWTHSPLASDVAAINLRAVWGSGPMDVYAVGTDPSGMGVILHFDGQVWSTALTTPAALTGISGSGPHEVIAVGANHTVLRFTGP